MALQIWLPLIKDTHNQGLLNDIIIVNNGAVIDNNGKLGSCYDFNPNGHIIVDNASLSANSWSISAWIYPIAETTGHQYIVSLNTSTSADFLGSLCLRRSKFTIRIGEMSYESTSSMTLNTWYHFTATFNGSKLSLYINGILDKSWTDVVAPVPASKVFLGMRGGTAGQYTGKLNDVRIYNHCLSVKEVKNISMGIIAHYTLNSSIKDSSGFNNNGYHTSGDELTYSSDSARYSNSATFNGTSNSISLKNAFQLGTKNSKLSFAFWMKRNSYSDSVERLIYTDICKIYLYTDYRLRISWKHESESASAGNTWAPNLLVPVNEWHHVCFTFDSGVLKLYYDGVRYGTSDRSSTGQFMGGAFESTYPCIGGSKYGGKLSDFRIYATALSEDDIKELYHTSAHIDKDGNIYGYEFMEVV